MHELELIALDAYRPVYGDDAIAVGGATCLRAPLAPDSPMLNRVVGLGDGSAIDEGELDEALAAMADTTFYVAVSPSADPRLDGLLEARGLGPGWGWMLFERGPEPAPPVETSLEIAEVDAARSEPWARIVATGFGLPEACLPMIDAVPSLPGWSAFLALDGDEPAAAAAVWTQAPAAYFGFAATLPEHRGKGGQGALFAKRIERALEAGCRMLVTETGELREDRASASYRNILRYGFEERFVVANRLRQRAPSALRRLVLDDRGAARKVVERGELERERMRRLQHDRRRDAVVERFLPAARAEAPTVARAEAAEAELRTGRREVVPHRGAEGEELLGHDGAHRVDADILAAGPAGPVAPEPGHGIEAARLERPTEDVRALRHGRIMPNP